MFGPTKTARTPNFRSASLQVPDTHCQRCQGEINPALSKEWTEYYEKIKAPPLPWFVKWLHHKHMCTCNLSSMQVFKMIMVKLPLLAYLIIRTKLVNRK